MVDAQLAQSKVRMALEVYCPVRPSMVDAQLAQYKVRMALEV